MILHDNKIRSQRKGQQQLVMWQQSQKATQSLAGGEQVTHFPQGWGFQLTVKFRHKLSHASGQSASGVCIPAPFPVPALEPSVKSCYWMSGCNFTSKLNSRVRAHRFKHCPCCPCCFFASMLTGQCLDTLWGIAWSSYCQAMRMKTDFFSGEESFSSVCVHMCMLYSYILVICMCGLQLHQEVLLH